MWETAKLLVDIAVKTQMTIYDVDHETALSWVVRAAEALALAKVTRVTTFNESGAYSDSELTNMAGNSIDRKKIRDELKIERTKLFKQFAKHPKDTRLALAIKILDDQIADCTEWSQTNDRNTEIERKNV